jgi:hypothetical protein
MGGGRDRDVSDPKPKPNPAQPDDELLEFLGGIDEVNDESQEDDFSDFLAKTDIDKLAAKQPIPKADQKATDEKPEIPVRDPK